MEMVRCIAEATAWALATGATPHPEWWGGRAVEWPLPCWLTWEVSAAAGMAWGGRGVFILAPWHRVFAR